MTKKDQLISTWLGARRRGRHDLFYLATEILGYKDFTRAFHTPVIKLLQQFPHPLPHQFDDYERHENGLFVYHPIVPSPYDLQGGRRRLILDPRGSFKSTLNVVCHTVQWILNYPNVTILLVHAKQEIVENLLSTIKGHFSQNPVFRDLYPDYCPPKGKIKNWGNRTEFTVPNRTEYRKAEPTVGVISIDGAITGAHYDVIKFTDIVDEVNTRTGSQMGTVTKAFGMYRNILVRPESWMDVEGTTYDFCLDGETGITMSDWCQKPIKDIRVGDEVVGWGLEGKRYLKPSKVIAVGSRLAETKRYTFASGRSIVCTPEHRFWRGKQWFKNSKNYEYGEIKRLKSVHRLLTPVDKLDSWEAGWLAAIYDGEGSWQQNPNHPSGALTITQTTHNNDVLKTIRKVLTNLGFRFCERWHDPSTSPSGKPYWHDRCAFVIAHWDDRYKFLQQIQPIKNRDTIIASLYGNLQTDEDRIVSVEDAGVREVFFFQCETGNYLADGVCSKNSDLYGRIIEAEAKKPIPMREWAIHVRGIYKKDLPPGQTEYTFLPEERELPDLKDSNGQPVSWMPERFSAFEMEKERLDPVFGGFIFSAQRLNNPVDIGADKAFPVNQIHWITPDDFKKVHVKYRKTTIDTAETDKEGSDFSVITTCAYDGNGRCYVENIRYGKWLPDKLIDEFIDAFIKHKAISIGIEETGFVRGIKPALLRRCQLLGIYPPFNFLVRDNQQSKKDRILNTLQPLMKRGDIRFLSDISCREQLVQELTRFPKYKRDDILDTLADQFQGQEWFGRIAPRPTFEEKAKETLNKFIGDYDPTAEDLGLNTPFDPDSYFAKTGGV